MIPGNLRQIDALRRVQLDTVARLAQCGLPARLTVAEARRRYLHLRIETALESFDALVEPAAWLAAAAPELEGLPLDEADEPLLLDLFAALCPVLPEDDALLGGARLAAQGLVTARGGLLAVPTARGELLCRTLPRRLWPRPARAPWVARLPLCLEALVGWQSARLALLRQIEPGDLVLVLEPCRWLSSNGRVLFDYSIKEEQIVVEQVQTEPVIPADSRPAAAIDSLPVRLEFVLQQWNVTVAELDAIGPGRVLALDADAERRVLLKANGAVLASGELVEVDGRLGVQIEHVLAGV